MDKQMFIVPNIFKPIDMFTSYNKRFYLSILQFCRNMERLK